MFQLFTPLTDEGLGPYTGVVLVKINKQRAWDPNPGAHALINHAVHPFSSGVIIL